MSTICLMACVTRGFVHTSGKHPREQVSEIGVSVCQGSALRSLDEGSGMNHDPQQRWVRDEKGMQAATLMNR